MRAGQLLAHFDRISDAPDAVARLRRFVFNLAVRGMLVEQNHDDQPVSELVNVLMAKKRRFALTANGQAVPHLSPADSANVPFQAPKSWQWLQLNEIGAFSGGMTPSKSRSDFWDGNINWFSPKDIKCDELTESELKITASAVQETGLRLYPPGCLFFVARSGILKRTFPVAINRVEATTNQDLKVLVPFCSGIERYLQIMFRGMTDFILSELVKTGTTVQSLKYEEFEIQAFPLPPLAEQRRIVAKVDELMALCDQLEAAQAEREGRRDRLAAASLARLNNGADAGAFREHARFHLRHLPRLATRPEHIKQLRQTILNLAVRGRLVQQDPNDEPATVLFGQIKVESQRLRELKGIREQKAAEPTHAFEAESQIPNSWASVYLQDLAYQITDGTHLTPKYTATGRPFLSAQNVKPFRFMPEQHRLVSSEDFERYRSNRKPERGDVLLTRVGAGIGEAAVLDSDFEFAFYVSLCLIKIPTRHLLPDFLVLWLNSPEGRQSSATRTYGKGASQGNLNLALIRTFKVPLPPLAEQRRIVARVDELMSLCDQLEAALTAGQTEGRRLVAALLHEALASSD